MERILLFTLVVFAYVLAGYGQLSPSGRNVCSRNVSHTTYAIQWRSRVAYRTYYSSCGFLNFDTCRRYRTVVNYRKVAVSTKLDKTVYLCCNGWSQSGNNCSTPICSPECQNGICVSPNSCSCNSGWNGNLCQNDIDECSNSSLNSCQQNCVNTNGSYTCSCTTGYVIATDKRKCQDIDECAISNGRCHHICINSVGSYQCTCRNGFKLSIDEKTCEDINECSTSNGGCNQICKNSIGSYQCICENGFRLSDDNKTCQDIDECQSRPCHNPLGYCYNTFGSFFCSCRRGYGQAKNNYTRQDCLDLKKEGVTVSGIYTIYPGGRAMEVYCDMKTDGGGWTVIQRRVNDVVNFYRGWKEYENGFGNLDGNFWLGLKNIHTLTSSSSSLRVDLAIRGESRYETYSSFKVGDEISQYVLTVAGPRGTAGDSMTYHNGVMFSTKDHNNDDTSFNCAVECEGAWWYKGCHLSNLNGVYLNGDTKQYGAGMVWKTWKGYYYSVLKAEMKIKRNG